MSMKIALLALALSILALATAVFGVAISLHAGGGRAREVAPRALDTDKYLTPPNNNCSPKGWDLLPPEIKGAWSSGEFEMKCKANRYVATCENRTLSFSDNYDEVCRDSRVVAWWKVPDA